MHLRAAALVAALVATPHHARADEASAQIPATLSLASALTIFHEHGLDLFIADTAVDSAEGDLVIARALPNPAVSLGVGRSTYLSCGAPGGCGSPPTLYTLQVSDQAAIAQVLSGKRQLRVDVADAARRAAKLSRVDAERTLAMAVKAQFEQVLVAQSTLQFATDTAAANATMLEKAADQAANGKIGDADVLRLKTAKLEADQAVDQAARGLRAARAQLAFLLGVRTAVPEFTVAEPALERYALPARLAAATSASLRERALAARPDLRAQEAQVASAEAQLALAQRERVPDVSVGLSYSQQGSDPNATTPPTIALSLSAPIPVLYRQQGEIQKAAAAVHAQRLLLEKARATVVHDVEAAYADFVGARAQLQRMEEGGLLATARTAKDAVLKAKELGAATLLDVLTAVATYIATTTEYQTDLANYWTAVFELEQAVGEELR